MSDSHPIPIRPRETVILARDFEHLVTWYQTALDFRVIKRFDELPYANLETAGGVAIGIGSAPPELAHADATVVPQIETDDVAALLQRVVAAGGAAQGPERDAAAGFSFGSFRDPEGNSWWVVDTVCP
ncbi:MAG: VOC family protein [Phycisphaerales bacterium]|jgi:predicted enzyme related to lactoylglutathione lyase|nr:VOC family protein [Phycisphaerales bacterium]